jgi:type II secretory pathway pseudopilin PulG
MIKINLKNKGFTLLEALVATSILMVAVVAPITIAQKGLSSAIYTKSQMIASYLAQDALEYIKNKRDENAITRTTIPGTDWLDGLDLCMVYDISPLGSELGCQIDTVLNSDDISDDIFPYSASSFLKKGEEDDFFAGFYQYEEGTETTFTRQIKVQKINVGSDKYAKVNVIVRWNDDPENKVDVTALIFNY